MEKRVLSRICVVAVSAVFAVVAAALPAAAQEAQGAGVQETQGAQETPGAQAERGLREMQQPEASPELQTAAAADDPARLWDKANTAYINGDYHTAVEVYNAILDRGLSSTKLYYNLGNAYFKQDDLGKAILCYNRALRLSPGNDDVRYNLEVAETMTKDNIERIPEFFLGSWLRAWRHSMSCTAWSIVSLVLLAAMLALGLLYLLAQRIVLRKAGFYGTLCALLFFVVAVLFAAAERRELLDSDEAVVMVSSAAVKSSPDKASTDLFVLHEGTKARITDRLDGWCEILIADGKKGWIEAKKIEII